MDNNDIILDVLKSMQNQMSEINNKVDKLSDQLTKVEVHLENVTDKNISLLMEQYNPNVDKLEKVVDQVDEMQFDLNGIKRVVISHSKEINILMKQ